MADSTVDQLRALLAKATASPPWRVEWNPDNNGRRVSAGMDTAIAAWSWVACYPSGAVYEGLDEADAALIVAAINALPKLLAVVEAAKAVDADNDGYGTRALHALRNALAILDAGSE